MTNNEKPHYWLGGKIRKSYDGDPDWDAAGSSGLKRIKSFHALSDYEQKGEPVYDEKGFYDGQAVNLKHHEELKKNYEANDRNNTITRAKSMRAYKEKHPNATVYYMQTQMNGARDYATKLDNRSKALAYHNGYYGFSTSKLREKKARMKKK